VDQSVARAQSAATKKEGYDHDMEHAIYSTWEDEDEPVILAAWERFAAAGKNADYRTAEGGWSIMMVAAGGTQNDPATVRDLALKLGCDVHAQDFDGWTPLHWAAFHGSVNGAKGVLNACAKLQSEESDSEDLVRALTTKDTDGFTPIGRIERELSVVKKSASGPKMQTKKGLEETARFLASEARRLIPGFVDESSPADVADPSSNEPNIEELGTA